MTPLEIVLDFVERGNKFDAEPEVAQAALVLHGQVARLTAERDELRQANESLYELTVFAEEKIAKLEAAATALRDIVDEAALLDSPFDSKSPAVVALAAIDGVKP